MAKNGGSFWTGGVGLLLLVILALIAGATGGSLALIYHVVNPPRDRRTLDPADLLLTTEDATFQASDGTLLSGWFVRGRSGWPAIILCHDLGGARSILLISAVALNRAGYPLFLLDFRGHGLSAGNGSTLGIGERLDILGAIEYLRTRNDIDTGRFGAWGIGMGAYAALLAAAEEKTITALALDSLYPDVETEVDRRVREEVPPALRTLLPVVRLFYDPYFSFKLRASSVANRIGDLGGRNVLFIAAAELPDRFQEAKALYAALPEVAGADKNFLEVRASVVTGLYAEDKKKYDEAIVKFFSTYLPHGARPDSSLKKKIQVLER